MVLATRALIQLFLVLACARDAYRLSFLEERILARAVEKYLMSWNVQSGRVKLASILLSYAPAIRWQSQFLKPMRDQPSHLRPPSTLTRMQLLERELFDARNQTRVPLILTEQNAMDVIDKSMVDLEYLFRLDELPLVQGITGMAEFVDLDGPVVFIRLRGLFPRPRDHTLKVLENYFLERIPESAGLSLVDFDEGGRFGFHSMAELSDGNQNFTDVSEAAHVKPFIGNTSLTTNSAFSFKSVLVKPLVQETKQEKKFRRKPQVVRASAYANGSKPELGFRGKLSNVSRRLAKFVPWLAAAAKGEEVRTQTLEVAQVTDIANTSRRKDGGLLEPDVRDAFESDSREKGKSQSLEIAQVPDSVNSRKQTQSGMQKSDVRDALSVSGSASRDPSASSESALQHTYILDGMNIMHHRNHIIDSEAQHDVDLDWDKLIAAGSYYTSRGHKVLVFMPRTRDTSNIERVRHELGLESIVFTPSGACDDLFMINYARDVNGSRIVTNDKFRDHSLTGCWVQRRTVNFAFAGLQFIPEVPPRTL